MQASIKPTGSLIRKFDFMTKNKFRPIDFISFAYIFINLLFILFGWKRILNPQLHFFAFLMIGIVIFLLIKYSHKSKILCFFRDWYPFLAFLYFFEVTSALNKVFFPDFIDPFFQKIDLLIFGYQPAIQWGLKCDNFFIHEIMAFSYFSYYLMFPCLGIFLYLKKRETFHKFVFNLSFVFYVCYLTYNVLPVAGGRYWDLTLELTKIYQYGLFSRIMAFIYNQTTHFGGAFPSSHVALSVAVTICALRHQKVLGYIFLILTFLLSISTVYLHYHYFIDTIFGIFYGIGFYFLAIKIFSKLEEKCSVS